MEGFKKIAKMQCFKEGGTVQRQIANFEKRERKTEEKADESQDKSMVKKGVKQHEAALHKGEPKTELKLKTGGRAKKETGTVKKYKTGGMVENQYAAKKTDKDIKDIANTKKQKPQMLCGGKSVKKMAAGGDVSAKLAELEKKRSLEKMARAKKYLNPSQQSELIKQSPAAAGLSAPAAAGVQPPAEMPPVDQMGSATGPAMKKGGKAKKACK